MTEDEANRRARELNIALGEKGAEDRFYVAEEVAPGEWEAVEHKDKWDGPVGTFIQHLGPLWPIN
jgi:hypothetical protein